MKPLCIYHGGCDDGFGAAMAVWIALNGNVELYPEGYGNPPPLEQARNRIVYIVDFSYKQSPMLDLCKVAQHVIVFDHHKTALNELKGLFEAGDISGQFDMNRSGAVITWQALCMEPVPKLYRYIQDRDLWKKELPDGNFVTFALRSYPQDVYTWEQLLYTPIDKLIEEGRSIHRYYRTLVDAAKHRARMSFWPTKHHVLTVNCDYSLASEVAGELAEEPEANFGACYYRKKDGRWGFSLRSRDNVNVREVAEYFGGGGHDRAAGFELDHLPGWVQFDDNFKANSR